MIERSPFDTNTALFDIQAARHARQIALRAVHINQLEIARQLRDLDNSIVGTSAHELHILRDQLPEPS